MACGDYERERPMTRLHFHDRRTECWTYPRISIYDDAWDGGAYLDFLEKDSDDDASLRIYVHVPFCKHFCTFCPYYKRPYGSVSRGDRMSVICAIATELELYAARPNISGRTLSAI